MRLDQSDFLRILTGKKLPSNKSPNEIYEYGHLGLWYIKATFYIRSS